MLKDMFSHDVAQINAFTCYFLCVFFFFFLCFCFVFVFLSLLKEKRIAIGSLLVRREEYINKKGNNKIDCSLIYNVCCFK